MARFFNRFASTLFVAVYFQAAGDLQSVENYWGNVIALSHIADDNRFSIWSYMRSAFYEYGIMVNSDRSFVYGNLALFKPDFEFFAGHLNQPLFHSFIVSYGESFPASDSMPVNRPLGYAFRIKNQWLSAGFADFWKSSSYVQALSGSWKTTEVKVIDASVGISNAYGTIKLISGILEVNNSAGFLMESPPVPDQFIPFANFRLNLLNALDFDLVYTGNSEMDMSFILNFSRFRIRFGYSIYNIRNSLNEFRSDFYSPERPFYFSVVSKNTYLKVFESDKKINIRWKVFEDNFGSYFYLKASQTLYGLFYKDTAEEIRPYAAVYFSPDFQFQMETLGISFGNKWMIAILHTTNHDREYFPYDPQAIPAIYYQESPGFDDTTVYNHSYNGLQFFWGNENLFIYTVLLQNFAASKLDSLVFNLRFQYRYWY